MHARKSLLFDKEESWIKKNGDDILDVTMGCFDGANIFNLSQAEYLKLSRLAKSTEIRFSPQKIKHENKLKRHTSFNNIDNQIVEPRMSCKPEKSMKHNITLQKKNLIRRLKNKFTRNVNLAIA